MGISDRDLRLLLTSLFDDLRSKSVDASTTCVVALECVTVGYASQLAYAYSARAFSREPILLIFTVHHFVRETALKKVEIQTVETHQLWQKHCLECFLSLETVSKHETTSLASMGMQIYIHAYLAIFLLLLNGFLYCPDSWLLEWVWVNIKSVQVLSQCIQSVVASIHSIWIQHRNYFKHIFVQEIFSLWALQIC